MGDDDSYGDLCRALRGQRRERRAKYGVDCPGCRKKEPKRIPLSCSRSSDARCADIVIRGRAVKPRPPLTT